MGAWIEIRGRTDQEKGLRVAPHMGAWIEISNLSYEQLTKCCRSPHGSVD